MICHKWTKAFSGTEPVWNAGFRPSFRQFLIILSTRHEIICRTVPPVAAFVLRPLINAMTQRLRFALPLVLALAVLAGSASAANPAGRWVGGWSSSSTGHRGPLRAKIRQVDHDTYRALFAGRFAKVIPFVYPARLDRIPGTWNTYRSTTRLPLMGEYRMTATVTSHRFNAVFESKKDRGYFHLSR